jgi:3',5'-cyclic AMP phosphodiesterase CpdA
MPRLAWLTDLHLNFVSPARLAPLLCEIEAANPDALLVGGDTGEAKSFAGYLRELAVRFDRPVYFVLGNHDYYGGSILVVREAARNLTRESPLLQWLPAAGVVRLSDQTALIGHDGWGDGRAASFFKSDVILNDYLLIEELRNTTDLGDGPFRPPLPAQLSVLTEELLRALHALGDEAAAYLRAVLPAALARAEHVLVLMHVPPFREACWYQGRPSDDNWAPHFTCQAAGEALLEIMHQHPHRRATVLCGHTHHGGRAEILPNLLVLTGNAEYGNPQIQQLLEAV